MQTETLVACILDMGELLLTSGAEVMRVEDTINRVCGAYGFKRTDVFTITSSILLTVQDEDGGVITQTRRIHRRVTDLERVERVNELARALCKSPQPLPQLKQSIKEIHSSKHYPAWVRFLVYMGASAVFSVFFGGTAIDALCSAIGGGVLFFLIKFGEQLKMNTILLSAVCSALTALVACGLVALGLSANVDKVIIGDIMLLIPGIALFSALRDLISGDLLSGLLGICEAALKAIAVAIGFALVLAQFWG